LDDRLSIKELVSTVVASNAFRVRSLEQRSQP
jgi:hypothetical protein